MIMVLVSYLLLLALGLSGVSRASMEEDGLPRHIDMTWYAPFYSGGGYCSEATSFMFALETVGYKNFSLSHHGDSFRQGYYSGLTQRERDMLQHYDISNRHARKLLAPETLASIDHKVISVDICHSEPGAWHAPSPRYHTVRCPSERRNLHFDARGSTVIPYNIGRTMFETDRLPAGWENRLNFMDEVWVPTESAKAIFLQAGVEASKLVVLGEAVDTDFFKPQDYHHLTAQEQTELGLPPSNLLLPYDSIFLFVGKFETRKGLLTLFNAYFTAFANNPNVLLLILTSSYHSSEDLYGELSALLERNGLGGADLQHARPRYLLLTDVKQEGMPYLYSAASALVRTFCVVFLGA
jgi:glycosyltransferase involved in cell wall biosynthesis